MRQSLSGMIVTVQPLEQGRSKAGKEYQKQTFVLSTGGMYPTLVAFEIFGQRLTDYQYLIQCERIVTVEYYPESRPWKNPQDGRTQYFTTLKVYAMRPAPADATRLTQ